MNTVATLPHQPSITATMAERYGMRPDAFEATLRATVIPSTASREELAAFLLVAKEYQLNPITREIYAFPKKGGGIQPIVGVDGWANIINSHPAFDGMDFEDRIEKGVVTAICCRIYRKDRTHPIEAIEYLAECHRGTEPWQKWPRRMLRHKAMIQAARYAFGYAGIVDPDEAERFTQIDADRAPRTNPAALERRLAELTQHPPQPAPPSPPPPQPRPPQPGGDDEDDWPPPLNGDHGPDADEPEDPMGYDTREEKRIDLEGAPPEAEAEDERARLLEAAHEKASKGSRPLRWWRARLTPEQVALIGDWSGLEEAAKAADG